MAPDSFAARVWELRDTPGPGRTVKRVHQIGRRLYRSDRGGPPIKEFDCNAFLEVQGKSLEADLEAGARIGDRAYWIGSHGRNIHGKERLNRCRFFATDIRVTGGEVTLTPVGKPYKDLLDDLIRDPRFEPSFDLAAAVRDYDAAVAAV